MSTMTQYVLAHKSADNAAAAMYESCNSDPSLLRRFYLLAKGLLISKFSESEAYSAINIFAGFDVEHEHKWVRRSANAFIKRYQHYLNHPTFINDLESVGIAGFKAGDLLYVASVCVKPNSLRYQVTVFGKGVGPLGDTQHNQPKEILLNDCRGAGIPISAQYLSKKDLILIEQEFMPN